MLQVVVRTVGEFGAIGVGTGGLKVKVQEVLMVRARKYGCLEV